MKLLNELYINTMNVIMPDGPVDSSGTYGGGDDNFTWIILLGIILLIILYNFFKFIFANKKK